MALYVGQLQLMMRFFMVESMSVADSWTSSQDVACTIRRCCYDLFAISGKIYKIYKKK